jgi:hypothetical protein
MQVYHTHFHILSSIFRTESLKKIPKTSFENNMCCSLNPYLSTNNLTNDWIFQRLLNLSKHIIKQPNVYNEYFKKGCMDRNRLLCHGGVKQHWQDLTVLHSYGERLWTQYFEKINEDLIIPGIINILNIIVRQYVQHHGQEESVNKLAV